MISKSSLLIALLNLNFFPISYTWPMECQGQTAEQEELCLAWQSQVRATARRQKILIHHFWWPKCLATRFSAVFGPCAAVTECEMSIWGYESHTSLWSCMLDTEWWYCYVFGRASIPEELCKYSNYHDGECCFPNERRLAKYQIIVCTLIILGRWICQCVCWFLLP
jgi:hypothetical protein